MLGLTASTILLQLCPLFKLNPHYYSTTEHFIGRKCDLVVEGLACRLQGLFLSDSGADRAQVFSRKSRPNVLGHAQSFGLLLAGLSPPSNPLVLPAFPSGHQAQQSVRIPMPSGTVNGDRQPMDTMVIRETHNNNPSQLDVTSTPARPPIIPLANLTLPAFPVPPTLPLLHGSIIHLRTSPPAQETLHSHAQPPHQTFQSPGPTPRMICLAPYLPNPFLLEAMCPLYSHHCLTSHRL